MYIRVHVVPGARKEKVTKMSDTEFTIVVREPRERNMANHRIRAVLAEIFNVPVTKVKLLTGHRSSTKIVDIEVY
jgi:uncharacterized protein YggU (UPF0235/DUF167 family)